MDYYDDLQFVNYGNAEKSQIRAAKRVFEGYYGIQYNYWGDAECRVGRHPFERVSGPHVFISYPGVEFCYGAQADRARSQMHVCFRGGRVERWIAGGLLVLRETKLYTRISDPTSFTSTMVMLFSHLRMPGEVAHAHAVLLVEKLLLMLRTQPEIPESGSSMYGEAFQNLCMKISAAPGQDWDFEQESARLALSHVHFRRLFSRFAGMPPGQFLLECRLRRAEKLLTSGTLRINEVARECGFSDEFHFSRIFRKYRTLSPSAFRSRYGM